VVLLPAWPVPGVYAAGAEELRVLTSNGDHYEARAVLIATGSSYRRTGAEGEDDLIGAGIHFCATCDGPFYKGSKQLMVLGGGNSGLEEGLFLAQFTDKVSVVEYKDRLAGSQVLQDKVAADPRMEVLLERKVVGFTPKDDGSGKVGTVTLEDLATGETEEHHPDGVFVFIGLDPNTGFVKGTVDLDERGFIATDRTLMTSVPGVFAAGDVRGGSTKQLASAVGEGAAVAIQIRGFLERQLEEAIHPGG
jgi:thioredoxin reductase (NADPH)